MISIPLENTLLLAQSAAPAGAQGGLLGSPMMLPILMIVVMYFVIFRPQQKRMKDQQDMLTALSKGDRVITNGGIIGTISKAPSDNGEVEIEIADGVKVTVLRYSVYKKYDPSEFAGKKDA